MYECLGGGCDDDGTGRTDRALGEQVRGGVGDLGHAAAPHLEHADLLRRAEAVLVRAQDAVRAAVTLELQHDVDEVLERLGAGEATVLGDVTDDDRGRARGLGVLGEARRALADLRERARQLLDRRRPSPACP